MTKVKQQHYVWRKYLKSWAKNEYIWCYRRNGNIFNSGLMGVGQERFFYKLNKLTTEDIAGIRKLYIDNNNNIYLRNLIEKWFIVFTKVFELKNIIDKAGVNNFEIEEKFEELICNTEEEIHSEIENGGIKFVDLLLNEDISFYENNEDKMDFIYFLTVQYMRTKKIQDSIFLNLQNNTFFNIKNSWGLIRHILATIMAWRFVNKNTFNIILLKNISDISFITGDQPVLNTHAVNIGIDQEIDKLELYYPISPKLAVLLSENIKYKNSNTNNVNQNEVEIYNKLVIDYFHEQVYSNSKETLEYYFKG